MSPDKWLTRPDVDGSTFGAGNKEPARAPPTLTGDAFPVKAGFPGRTLTYPEVLSILIIRTTVLGLILGSSCRNHKNHAGRFVVKTYLAFQLLSPRTHLSCIAGFGARSLALKRNELSGLA